MRIRLNNIFKNKKAFTLMELMAALIIGATVLVAVIGVYNQMQTSAQALNKKFADGGLGEEILQRIAEDLDRIILPVTGPASDTSIAIKNKYDQLYRSAQLTITRTYFDNKNQKQTFERITWQSNYDFDANSLIIYRAHTGIITEDTLLDSEKSDLEKELFIPIASGLSYFSIEVPQGDIMLNSWTDSSLPKAIAITISFGRTYSNPEGNWDVDEADKITRTIAIDRAKMMKFVYVPPNVDANDINDLFSDTNDINQPDFNPDDFNEITEEEPETND